MDASNLLVESWLEATTDPALPSVCLNKDVLTQMCNGMLGDVATNDALMHLIVCRTCRAALARVSVAVKESETEVHNLRTLLHTQPAAPSWRNWVRGLVRAVEPLVDSFAEAVDDVMGRIDARGRLFTNIEMPDVVDGSVVCISIVDRGRHVDLCEVTVSKGRARAIVDLSALSPRTGVLREGVLRAAAKESVPAPEPALLPQLIEIATQQYSDMDLLDKVTDLLAACEGKPIEALRAELPVVSEDQRQALTIAYATLSDVSHVWWESNSMELAGISQCLRQIENALSPRHIDPVENTDSGANPAQDEETTVLPTRRPNSALNVANASGESKTAAPDASEPSVIMAPRARKMGKM